MWVTAILILKLLKKSRVFHLLIYDFKINEAVCTFSLTGNAELVETLIKHGADVNIFNEKETITALMDVCHAGHTHLIDVLLQVIQI